MLVTARPRPTSVAVYSEIHWQSKCIFYRFCVLSW